jgi:6-phosphogluconolactonase
MKDKKQNIFNTSAQEFNEFSANFIKEKLNEMAHKKVINVALSGGSTPIPILTILKEYSLNWDCFNFFLVDERFVDTNSSESNFKNINEYFFKFISSKSFSILQENLTLDELVNSYRKKIKENLVFTAPNLPKFDMIILGMGADGHTASLFPNSKALNEKDAFIVKNYIPQLDSFRITLTFPTLLNCDEVIVLSKGSEKEKVFKEVINNKGNKYPISQLLNAKINWIIGTLE